MEPLVTPFLTRVLTIILLIQQLMSPGTIPGQAPLTDIAVPVMVTCPVSDESPFNLSDTD